MGHGPAVKLGKDNAAEYKTRLGVRMFFAYTVIYVIFVAINVNSPTTMESEVLGTTLAVTYGFGLIIVAIIQALVYNHLCTKAENELNK